MLVNNERGPGQCETDWRPLSAHYDDGYVRGEPIRRVREGVAHTSAGREKRPLLGSVS